MVQCSKEEEIIGTNFCLMPGYDSPFTVHTVGSTYEGTKTEGMNSDIDQILVINVPVITKESDADRHAGLLMVEDETIPPGYVKLQPVVRNDIGVKDKLFDKIVETLTDKYQRPVIKLKESELPKYMFGKRHGPAFTAAESSERMEQDYVFAFRHRDMPDCFRHWYTRKRRFHWPPKRLLKSCKSLGCLFVHVGHRRSDEFDLEWRMSFSLQERLLISNFNSVQLKCLVLLKMVKKDIIQKFTKCESITSYHCKTCMFYMVETTPTDMWRPNNLLNCLTMCLQLLMKWLREGNCPNYFIPSENMFDGKITIYVRRNVYQILNDILGSSFQHLTAITSDDLGMNLMKACIPKFKMSGGFGMDDSINIRQRLKFVSCRAFVLSICHMRNSFLFRNHDSSDPRILIDNLKNTIRRFKSVKTLCGNTGEATQRALSLILPQLELSLASNELALRIKEKESDDELMAHLTSNLWDVIGKQSDPVSAKLKQATFMYACGHYAVSLEILESLKKRTFLSVCSCDRHDLYPEIDDLMAVTPADQEISLDYHFRKLLTPCVVFLRPEGEILPPPLLYEMFRVAGMTLSRDVTFGREWYTWVVVDAQVLLHFMIYLNHKKLDMKHLIQKDMDNMLNVIREKNGRICHIETALNLFGWMHHREHEYEKALGCYRQSLYFQPEYNAARWHFKQHQLELQSIIDSFPVYSFYIFKTVPKEQKEKDE